MTNQTKNIGEGVPKQIFNQFLKKLEEEKVAIDVITRLNKTLIKHGNVSETAIKLALFSNNIEI